MSPYNLIIGMGNTGCQIIKEAAQSSFLTDCKFYAIDSVASTIDMSSVGKINSIPIIADDKCGSGRSRERGAAMFQFHDENGSFNELYTDAENAKTPVIVITSSAGGTGSGSTPCLCKKLNEAGIQVIPVIVCPALNDPDAFHLNTMDLMMELEQSGVTTYSMFRNEYGKADYTDINREVVTLIEIILGKHYEHTDKDSIDDSDLDTILGTPGRFIAVRATATNPSQLKRTLTEKILNGTHQQSWSKSESENVTMMTAFSLSSPFASGDFEEVFSELNSRIPHRFDEYRNICNKDDICDATVIVAGLPRANLTTINSEFQTVASIGDGISTKAVRPGFMQKKGQIRSVKFDKPKKPEIKKPATTPEGTVNDNLESLHQFNMHK